MYKVAFFAMMLQNNILQTENANYRTKENISAFAFVLTYTFNFTILVKSVHLHSLGVHNRQHSSI